MTFLNAAAWVEPEHVCVLMYKILIYMKHHIYPSYSRRMFEIWTLRRSDTLLFISQPKVQTMYSKAFRRLGAKGSYLPL